MLLMQKALIGTILHNKWWYATKRTIKFEFIRYNIGLVTRECKREEELDKALVAVMNIGRESQLRR